MLQFTLRTELCDDILQQAPEKDERIIGANK